MENDELALIGKYMNRVDGIDKRMRAWILADRKRMRNALCRCWLNPMYRAIEVTQDATMWRIWTNYEVVELIRKQMR